MKKITQKACDAFKYGGNFRSGNTRVDSDEDGAFMFLHDNLIADLNGSNNVLTLSSCGWETNATKERLNGLLAQYGDWYIYQKNFKWTITNGVVFLPFEDGMKLQDNAVISL